MRRLLPLLVLPLLAVAVAVAAPVPKETEKAKLQRLFGEMANPKEGYHFALDDRALVLTMAANASEDEVSEKTPPRVEQQVTGDFEAAVTITFAPPQKKYDDNADRNKSSRCALHLTGLCVWAEDGRNWAGGRFYGSSGGSKNPDGWGSAVFVRRTPNAANAPDFACTTDTTFRQYTDHRFRLRREGDRLKTADSADGKKWSEWVEEEFKLPDTVRVGVFGLNTFTAECTATFSDFTITPLKPDK